MIQTNHQYRCPQLVIALGQHIAICIEKPDRTHFYGWANAVSLDSYARSYYGKIVRLGQCSFSLQVFRSFLILILITEIEKGAVHVFTAPFSSRLFLHPLLVIRFSFYVSFSSGVLSRWILSRLSIDVCRQIPHGCGMLQQQQIQILD
jgi:hypothetical protein